MKDGVFEFLRSLCFTGLKSILGNSRCHQRRIYVLLEVDLGNGGWILEKSFGLVLEPLLPVRQVSGKMSAWVVK